MSRLYGSSGIGEPLYRGGLTPEPPPGDHSGLGLILFDPTQEDAELEATTTEPEPVELTLRYDSTADAIRWDFLPVFAVGTFAVGVAVYLLAERGYI